MKIRSTQNDQKNLETPSMAHSLSDYLYVGLICIHIRGCIGIIDTNTTN
jgi:hypothetical protein